MEQQGTLRQLQTTGRYPTVQPCLAELPVLHAEIASCQRCPTLKPWCRFGTDFYGNPSTGCLLVGEAPGFRSLKNRRRFTGPAGMLIRRALWKLHHPQFIDLEDLFYITDVVKCHPAPPGNPVANRSPKRAEIKACLGYLVRELRTLRPSRVVTFGKTAADAVAQALSLASLRQDNQNPPRIIHFPHPSPRNQVTILRQYPSMQAFEEAIAVTFHKLITELEARSADA